MENQIEKKIELKAPISRVRRALTDYREFGEWFRVSAKRANPFEQTRMFGNMFATWAMSLEPFRPEAIIGAPRIVEISRHIYLTPSSSGSR